MSATAGLLLGLALFAIALAIAHQRHRREARRGAKMISHWKRDARRRTDRRPPSGKMPPAPQPTEKGDAR